jgi:hypothetical protein
MKGYIKKQAKVSGTHHALKCRDRKSTLLTYYTSVNDREERHHHCWKLVYNV